MNAVGIVLLCVAACLIAVALRVDRPEMAFTVALGAGVVACLMSLGALSESVTVLTELSGRAGVENEKLNVMLRAAGIALLCEFGAQLCRDAGESALAGRIEFSGRTAILVMSLPLLTGLTSRLTALFP